MTVDQIIIELLRERTAWQRRARIETQHVDAQQQINAAQRIAIAIEILEPLTKSQSPTQN